MTGGRLCAGWHLGKKKSTFCNAVLQVCIFRRVGDIDAASDHRNGASGKAAIMRCCINAPGQTGDNDISLLRQLLGK